MLRMCTPLPLTISEAAVGPQVAPPGTRMWRLHPYLHRNVGCTEVSPLRIYTPGSLVIPFSQSSWCFQCPSAVRKLNHLQS